MSMHKFVSYVLAPCRGAPGQVTGESLVAPRPAELLQSRLMKLPVLACWVVVSTAASGLFAADDTVSTHRPGLTPLQRLQPEQLKAAHEAVTRFARQRIALPELGALEDFRA